MTNKPLVKILIYIDRNTPKNILLIYVVIPKSYKLQYKNIIFLRL